jgi:hypothetical protein
MGVVSPRWLLAAAGAAVSAGLSEGAVVLDNVASVGEWPAATLLYPPPSKVWESGKDDALFVQYDAIAQVYSFMVKPRTGNFLFESRLFLDIDRNTNTGFDRSKSSSYAPPGFDVLVRLNYAWWPQGNLASVDLFPGCHYLDAGCAAKLSLPASQFNSSSVADFTGEFTITKAQLEQAAGRAVASAAGDVDVALGFYSVTSASPQVGTATNEPFTFQGYLSFFGDLMSLGACAGAVAGEQRGAVLYSTTARDSFFQDKAYSQLFGAMQYQLYQAGLPHDRVSIAQLKNYKSMCKYRVIVVPYEATVKQADLAALVKSFFVLRYRYGVGLITAGNFLTNLAPGESRPFVDPYLSMAQLLGVLPELPVYAQTTKLAVWVSSVTHPIAKGTTANQVLFTNASIGLFTNMYVPHAAMADPGNGVRSAFSTTVVAKQTMTAAEPPAARGEGRVFNAILANEIAGLNSLGWNTGRVAHFATIEMMANDNLVWRAAQWVALSAAQPVGLGLSASRMAGLMTIRNDCDQSMFEGEGSVIEKDFADNIAPAWKSTYNAVISYYINVGNNPADGEFTDWSLMKPVYTKLLNADNEVSSHSYTHPHNINLLSNAQLDFEFGSSQAQIAGNLSLGRVAAAQPGATEDLRVALYLGEKFFSKSYFSGGFSGVGAGYPGVFGYLTNSATAVYVAPNYLFDFTMIQFQKLTAAAASKVWADQVAASVKLANTPFGHWPIHDYGPRNWGGATINQGPGYTMGMFTGFLDDIKRRGHEFATTLDLSDRLRAFNQANVKVMTVRADVLAVAVRRGAGLLSLGRLALAVVQPGTTLKIVQMANWFAYSADKVFVAAAGIPASLGATATLGTGAQTATITRLSGMPMRAELLSVSGNATTGSLVFSSRGAGVYRVTLSSSRASSMYKVATTPLGLAYSLVAGTTNQIDFTVPAQVNSQNLPVISVTISS